MARVFLARKHESQNKKTETPTLKEVLAYGGQLSEQELRIIERSASVPAPVEARSFQWAHDSFRFAVVSDTHNGHIKSKAHYWQKAMDLCGKEKVNFIFHTGDISDGMSGRPGHIYELEAIGASAQCDLSAERFSIAPVPIHGITGNHDAWAFKAVGFDFGKELQNRIPDKFVHLGAMEHTVTVGGVKIMLWHGEDGASYALSYRVQKFAEGLSGGEKPHIILSGHAHKAIYFMYRNIACFEAATLCGQTQWMRGKKLAAHVGFWIVEVWPAPDGGIQRIRPEYIPFFTEGDDSQATELFV
jgi:predicted phosphodiesterase